MPWKAALLFLAFPAFLSFRRQGSDPLSHTIDQQYQRADHLFNLPNADSAALAAYNDVIRLLERSPQNDHTRDLFFQCYFRKAIEAEIMGRDQEAKNSYLTAFRFPAADSLLFQLNIYSGCIYYKLNNFDSANFFLLKAESLINPSSTPEDKIRLYNTLGVLYYDNGNYLQCKNYLIRALQIVKSRKIVDKPTMASLQTNIATAYYRIGMYGASLGMFRQALAYHLFQDQIYINMGRSNAELKEYEEALACFRKVDPARLPGVLNEMANVKLKELQPDSCSYFLDRFKSCVSKSNNDLDEGFNESVRSDLFLNRGDPVRALHSLQRAINIFSGKFSNEDIHANPRNFTGTFAYHGLFDALSKKAVAWEQCYQQSKNPADLRASLDTYDASMVFLSYIEKSYDMDDAKILLKEKSARLYDQALKVCLHLSDLYPDSNYLEKAFAITERSKASVISSNLKQRSFHPLSPTETALLEQERNTKYNIARLNGQTDEMLGKPSPDQVANEKAGYEIELAGVQKKLEQSSRYYQLKYEDDHPDIKTLQAQLDRDQALICFSNAADAIHVFIITRSSFTYQRISPDYQVIEAAASWIKQLRSVESGRKFSGGEAGQTLYEHLIRPIRERTKGRDRWIIIPDGFFYFLPFESLPADEAGNPLLETTTIRYQFSSRFIAGEGQPTRVAMPAVSVLSFAPFADSGADFHNQGLGYMARLPASAAEISGLPGKELLDRQATKQAFIHALNAYPVIHLATHAVSDVADPAASFIAFYPGSGTKGGDCLFLDELYALDMDSSKLVIISACETGNGQLISQEGVMSLSRAFMYAGCQSTVNSLWKADDQSTAAILKNFHAYLEKGLTKSKALQRAKLDYIAADPLHRSPAYWSHLILTGDDAPLYKEKRPYWWAVVMVIFSAMTFSFVKGRKRKESRRFSSDGGF
jgi:CHAT domain-containing protein